VGHPGHYTFSFLLQGAGIVLSVVPVVWAVLCATTVPVGSLAEHPGGSAFHTDYLAYSDDGMARSGGCDRRADCCEGFSVPGKQDYFGWRVCVVRPDAAACA